MTHKSFLYIHAYYVLTQKFLPQCLVPTTDYRIRQLTEKLPQELSPKAWYAKKDLIIFISSSRKSSLFLAWESSFDHSFQPFITTRQNWTIMRNTFLNASAFTATMFLLLTLVAVDPVSAQRSSSVLQHDATSSSRVSHGLYSKTRRNNKPKRRLKSKGKGSQDECDNAGSKCRLHLRDKFCNLNRSCEWKNGCCIPN